MLLVDHQFSGMQLTQQLDSLAGGGQQNISSSIPSFRDYKLSGAQFVIWQITKILLFGAFFANIMFGFAAMAFIDGNTLGIENVPKLFSLPFVTPDTESKLCSLKMLFQ